MELSVLEAVFLGCLALALGYAWGYPDGYDKGRRYERKLQREDDARRRAFQREDI
jgi:hypothetical protein